MSKGQFYLDKWFLDFVGENGETFIFYAAKLKWHGITVPYTSILHYSPGIGVNVESRFTKVSMPQTTGDNFISWSDAGFDIEGTWKPTTTPIQQRIFDSDQGNLDWNCLQPASEVELKISGKTLKGQGYAEQLILTTPPWNIPMDELRWGRFGSNSDKLVWIELKGAPTHSWLWRNGKGLDKFSISDDRIYLEEVEVSLQLDKSVVLESERKIHSVVKNLLDFIPGFNKLMPVQFLMAEEHKWLSKGKMIKNGEIISQGFAIHELVNFKPPPEG